MPNWCENILEVTGPPAEVKRFRRETRGQDELDFETILPTPPEMLNTTSNTGMPEWYNWRTSSAGWGTKWGVDIDGLDEAEGEVVYRFESAWSPPEAIVFQLGAMYPALRFSLVYAEGGNCFAGSLVIDQGELVEDQDFDSRDEDALYQFVLDRLGQDWKSWYEDEEDEDE